MKRDELKAAVKLALPFAARKSVVEIFQHLRLARNGSSYSIEATDLDSYLTLYVGERFREAEETLIACVHGRTLRDALPSLPKGEINAELDGRKLRLSADGAVSSLAISPDPWMEAWRRDTMHKITTLNGPALRSAIERVLWAVVDDKSRPILEAVLFEWGEKLTLVAANGFCLSKTEIDLPAPVEHADLLLPGHVAKKLLPLLASAPAGDVDIYAGEDKFGNDVVKRMCFSAPTWDVIVTLTDGKYLSYKHIIPAQPYPFSCAVDTRALVDAMRKAMPYAKRIDAGVTYFDATDGKLSIFVQTPEGDYSTSIPASYTCEASWALDAKYVLGAASVIASTTTTIAGPAANAKGGDVSVSPFIVEGGEAFTVIMPICLTKKGGWPKQ